MRDDRPLDALKGTPVAWQILKPMQIESRIGELRLDRIRLEPLTLDRFDRLPVRVSGYKAK